MSKFEQKSAIYEKLCFFKRIFKFEALFNKGLRGQVVKGQICLTFEKFEESQVQFPSHEDDFISSFKLITISFFICMYHLDG